MNRFVLLMLLLPLLQTVAGQTHTLTTCSGVPYNFSVVSEPVGTTYTWTTPTVTGATGGVSSPTPKLRLTDTLVNNNIVDGQANYIINTSTGNTYTLRVTVRPFPVADAIADQAPICANAITPIVPFSGPTPNTRYYWNYGGPNIGITTPESDPNQLNPYTAVNLSNTLITATISVIPAIGVCNGNPITFKIPVKPQPVISNVSNQTLCNGVNYGGIAFSSNIPGSIITWTNTMPSIGILDNGISAIPSFTPQNFSTSPITAQIEVSGFSNGCSSQFPEIYTYNVYPIPTMLPVGSFEICGALSPTVTFASPGYVGVNYIWTNSNTSNGLPASSNGQINTLIANNFTSLPTTSEFEVRPNLFGCIGLPVTFTMTVKSTPQVINPGSKIICANNLLAPILFTGSSVSGTEYQWQRTGDDVGIPQTSDVGDIPAFTATNFGIMPISSSFIVRPFSNACYGPSINFTIRVNPTPTVLQEVDQVNCEYLTTLPVTFSGSVPGTIYNWMNTEAAIGIPNSGSGNIGVLTYSNPGSVDLIGVITVTPMSNTCSGIPMSYSYTTKAAPDMVIPLSQTFCNGVLTTPINFVPTTMAGTVFNWTRTSTNIGTIPLTATGNIDPFTATNIQFVPIQSVFTVTPFSNGCNGPIRTFRITVNPTPNVTVTPSGGVVICSGLTTTIQFSGSNVANTTYTWTNTNPAIGGIASSGSGSVISFTTTNTANIPITSLLQVIPVSNSCAGTPVQLTIIVKPTPVVSPVSPQILCAGVSTNPILFSGSIVDGTIFNWVQSFPDIGLATLASSGPIAAFTTTNIYNVPISSLFTVTPFSNGCSGSSRSFSIVVNPLPSINPITDRIVCSGTLITLPLIGSLVNNTNFSWTNNNSSIGIALAGSTAGSSIAFTATNNSVIPITGRLVITPFSNGCNGIPTSFSITVQPPVSVNAIPDQVRCNGTLTNDIIFSGSPANTVYNWTQLNNLIGLPGVSGTGDILAFTTNTGGSSVPIVSVFTVSPFSNGCNGPIRTFSITVNPTPSINTITDRTVCSGSLITLPLIGSVVNNTVFSWTNDNSNIGIAAVGSMAGSSITFTATNNSNIPITGRIVITPFSNGCNGTPTSFSITVQRAVSVSAIPDQVKCNGIVTNDILFTGSNVANTVFTWTQSNNLIGLPAITGTGDILAFTTNTGGSNVPIVSVFTVTPMSNSCSGVTRTFSILVNPVPSVTSISSVTYCSETASNLLFTGSLVPGTQYQWTNTNPSIGLAASGVGNINSFTLTNSSNIRITANIIVTPVSNSCNGIPTSFSITVQPAVSVNAIPDQVRCNGIITNDILFTGSSLANTVYSWTQNNNLIGLPGLSGTGDILSFTTNTGGSNVPIISLFTVTPMSNSCSGTARTFSILVNPIPTINPISSGTYCSGIPAAYLFSGVVSGTQFNWTNTNSSIGLAASGVGSINSFTLINGSNIPITANILVTPVSNSCFGTPNLFTITVNPIPSVTAVPDQSVCNNTQVQAVTFVGSALSGTSYQWVRTNLPIGAIALSGTGNIPAFTGQNIGNVPVTSVFTVTPFSSSCSGTPMVFSITVNPLPTIDPIMSLPICAGVQTGALTFSGSSMANTQFSWTNTNTTIGLAASGTGSITSFTALNTSNVDQTADITVTPMSNSCSGSSYTFQLVIKPAPTLSPIASQEVCAGAVISAINFTGTNLTGSTINWTNNNINTGLLPSGTGNINAFTSTNLSNSPFVSSIQVIATRNGCSSVAQTFTIRVNPTPTLISPLLPTGICNNSVFSYTLQSATPGTSFLWQRMANVTINGNTTSGGLTQFIYEILNSTNTLSNSAIYAISITANGCTNAQTIAVTITPSAVLSSAASIPAVCSGSILNYLPQTTSPNTLISWSRSVTAGITNPANTGINTISEILTNNTYSAINVEYRVTLTTAGCSNSQTVTATILPTPTVSTQNFSICSGGIINFTPINSADSTQLTWELPVILPNGSLTGATNATNWRKSFSQQLLNTTSQVAYALYTVKTSANNCAGNSFSITVQVLPSAVINSVTLTGVCSGSSFTYIPPGVATDTRYSWALPDQVPKNSLSGATAGNNEIAFTQSLFALNIVKDTAIYTVQASSPNCVGTTFTITVYIVPTPFVNNITDSVCSGERYTLLPQGTPVGTQYIWSIPAIQPLGSVIGTTSQAIPVNAFTQAPVNISTQFSSLSYRLNAVFENCISQPITVNLTVTRPIPRLTTINQTTCSGVLLTVTPANMPTGISYSWDVPINNNGSILGGMASAGMQSSIQLLLTNRSNISDTIQYIVVPHLDNCTGQSFTTNITVTPLPKAAASGPGYICNNVTDSITINFTGNAPYSFAYNDNGNLGQRSNITANPYTFVLPPAGSGVTNRSIQIYQLSNANCSNINDTLLIYQEVKGLPSGKIRSLHGTYICNGILDTLHVLTADSVGYQWKWNGNNIPCATGDSLFTNIAGIYQVTLRDGFGCSDTTTNSIRLIASRAPTIKFKQDIQCINSTIKFTNQTDSLLSGPLSWKWDFGNGLLDTQYHATTTYQVSGSYHVIVTATQQNCGAFPPTVLDSVIQIAAPIEAVDSLNVKAYKNQNTTISARFIPNYKYEWRNVAGTTAGLRNANNYETVFNFAESVRYGIKLISPQGCVTSDSMWVRVFNVDVIDIFVPKTFTPNNDGKNDKIFPYLTPGIKIFNYFKIYNRFGNVLFLTKDYSQGWDGRLNGVNQPMGIYFWEASYIDANNVQQSKFGQFLLSR